MEAENLVKLCKICGDQALYFNYHGNLSCESCKELKCRNGDGKCKITIQNRRLCTRCRLERCLENGMSRKSRKISKKDQEKNDASARVSNSQRRHLFISSLADNHSHNRNINQIALEKEKQMYSCAAEKFIELQLKSKLSTDNIDNPEFQNFAKLKRRNTDFQHVLALNAFEEKEIDALTKAYDAAFGDELTAKVIHKPQTVQELLLSPDVYVRRTIAFCQHFSGFNALSGREQTIILKPFIFEAMTVKFVFAFDPEDRSVSMFCDNSGKEVYEVEHQFCMKHITDQSVPEESTRCASAIRRSLDGDRNLRSLFSAQMLFQPREVVVDKESLSESGQPGSFEFMRYHFIYYSKLLQRYLESKYRSEEKAERKYANLQKHRTQTIEVIKNNKKKILDQIVEKLELPEIIQELYDLT